MAERFFVRNNSGMKVQLPLETAGRVIVAPGDQLEYSSKAAAEAAANDFNSTLYKGSPVEVVTEIDEVVPAVDTDELPEIEEEPGVTEPIIDGPSANTPDAPSPDLKEGKKETVTFTGDPNAALKGI